MNGKTTRASTLLEMFFIKTTIITVMKAVIVATVKK